MNATVAEILEKKHKVTTNVKWLHNFATIHLIYPIALDISWSTLVPEEICDVPRQTSSDCNYL